MGQIFKYKKPTTLYLVGVNSTQGTVIELNTNEEYRQELEVTYNVITYNNMFSFKSNTEGYVIIVAEELWDTYVDSLKDDGIDCVTEIPYSIMKLHSFVGEINKETGMEGHSINIVVNEYNGFDYFDPTKDDDSDRFEGIKLK